jgi:type IV pilus assembly protein PilC
MATAGKATKKEAPKESDFSWEGKNKAGKVVRGEIRAASESAANASLRRQGITISKLKKRKTSSSGKVTDKDITLFTRQLATMMKAGVPLLQAFDIVGKGTNNGAVSQAAGDIKARCRNRLQSESGLPQVPPALRPAVLQPRVGRRAGRYSRQLLDRLATYKRKDPRHQGQDQVGDVLPGFGARHRHRDHRGDHDFRHSRIQEGVFASFGADCRRRRWS